MPRCCAFLRNPNLVALVGSAILLLATSNAEATVVFEHSGMAAPSTEGWIEEDFGHGSATTGAIDDTGTPAWFVNDSSTGPASALWFRQELTDSQISEATIEGWRLRSRLRVPTASVTNGANGSVIVAYRNGIDSFQMNFSHDSSGNTVVGLQTIASGTPSQGPDFTVPGGLSLYHDYELIFDVNAGSADLFVDGVEVISNYDGLPLSGQKRVAFGTERSLLTGQGNFHHVEFEIGADPEPIPALSESGLMVLAGTLFALVALVYRASRGVVHDSPSV